LSDLSCHCTKSTPCTSTGSHLIQAADESTVSSSSTGDKDSQIHCTASNKPVSFQCSADLVTCKKSFKSEPADGICESANDLKCTAVCSAEKQSKSDRRQRQGKRPDIQRYVPKPKLSSQHDPLGNSGSSTVNVKSFDRSTPFESESASVQTKGASESSRSAAASLPQSSANQTPDVSKSSDHGNILEPVSEEFRQPECTSAAERCNSKSLVAAASLSHCLGDLSLSASKTTELRGSSKGIPDRVKQKVSKPVKSQNSEAEQEVSEYFLSASASKIAENGKRGKPGDSIRSENLDWDFDGEFEWSLDGVSWGDLPPPSDHSSSDEESRDDFRVPTDSAVDTQKQKARRPRAKRRRGTRKKQIQNTEIFDSVDNAAAQGKLINSRGNSSTAVEAHSFESLKPEKIVGAAGRFVEDCESPVHSDDGLSKNYDVNDHCLETVNTNSYSYSHRQKNVAEKPRLAVRTELEQTTGSKEQRRGNRNTVQVGDKRHSDANLKGSKSKQEESAQRQRPDSGRVGGIIRLPVGTVTAASQVTSQSAPPQVATSTRGRNRRPVHGTTGRRALWNPGESESLSSLQRLGSAEYEQGQLPAAYPAHSYQRQSASPQLYYTDYPPVSGALQMPAADGYVYGYPQAAYDALGYVDDSYYH